MCLGSHLMRVSRRKVILLHFIHTMNITLYFDKSHFCKQWNSSGSNSFGTMEICSRQGKFELMSVNHSARSDGTIEIFIDFL